eukprot:CAMPEP_0177759228 /NCGR_PEP_ID=MMETSP0491_2-20121128/4620_1 /TAXON_ID=63592 /ORGANISM="Tetraselmis chuii, Strain PLY429" /LENGTH=1426 /DNA_ID=CAMNT_0019275043 /DNA_START=230 /DNA_END=4510 /DNA_ORIENTATION=-
MPSNSSSRKPGSLKPDTLKLLNSLGSQELVDAADTCRVVWAKVKGHPYWPAQVMPNKAADEMMRGVHRQKEQNAPVQFFGTLEIAWMRDSDTVKWQQGMGAGYFHKGKTKRHFITSLEQVQTFLLKRNPPQGWWGKPPDKRILPVTGTASASTRRATATLAEGSTSTKQKTVEPIKIDRARSRRESGDDAAHDSRSKRRQTEEVAKSNGARRLSSVKEQSKTSVDVTDSPRRPRRAAIAEAAVEVPDAATPGRRTRRAIQSGVFQEEEFQPNLENPEVLMSSRSSRAKRPRVQDEESPDDGKAEMKEDAVEEQAARVETRSSDPKQAQEASKPATGPEAADSSANGNRNAEAAGTFMSASNSKAEEAAERAATAISSVAAEASMGSNDTAGGFDEMYGEHRVVQVCPAGKSAVPVSQQGEACHSKPAGDEAGSPKKLADPTSEHRAGRQRNQRLPQSKAVEGSSLVNEGQAPNASAHDSTWQSERGSVDASISNGRVSRNGRIIKAPRKPGAADESQVARQPVTGAGAAEPHAQQQPDKSAAPAQRRRIMTTGLPPQAGVKRRIIQMPGIPPAGNPPKKGVQTGTMQHANSVPASSIRHEAERKPRQEQGQMGHAKSAPDAGTDDPDTSDTPKKTIKQKLLDLPADCHISHEDLDRDDIPSYETVKKNLYPVTERPKRLSKSDIKVCSCAPTRDALGTGLIGCNSNCRNAALFLTCDTRLCPCGLYCSNKPFNLRPVPKLRVFHTGNRGWGVSSVAGLTRGTFICEYVGEVVDWQECTRRLDEGRQSENGSDVGHYIMELEPGLYIDAREKGNLARLMNSSCEPNAETRKWRDAATGEVHIVVVARRDIQPGEEVTYDYQYEHHGLGEQVGKYECLCGSEQCRGTMDRQPERCKDHGRRVEVYWEADGVYYRGSVRGYNPRTKKHVILYDDNEEERVNLKEVPHRWLDDSAPMEPHPPGAGLSRSSRENGGLAQQRRGSKPPSRAGAPIKKSGQFSEPAAQHSKLGYKLQKCTHEAPVAEEGGAEELHRSGSGSLYSGTLFRKAAPPILSQRPVLPKVEHAERPKSLPVKQEKLRTGKADDDNMEDAAKSLVSIFHSPNTSPSLPASVPEQNRFMAPSGGAGGREESSGREAHGHSRMDPEREGNKATTSHSMSMPQGAAPAGVLTDPAALAAAASAGFIPMTSMPPPGWHPGAPPPIPHLGHPGAIGPGGPPHLLNPHAIQQHILQQQIQQQVAALHAAGVHPTQITAALHAGLFQAAGQHGPPGAPMLVPQMMVGGAPGPPPPHAMHPHHAVAMSGPDPAGSRAQGEGAPLHFQILPPGGGAAQVSFAMPIHTQAEAIQMALHTQHNIPMVSSVCAPPDVAQARAGTPPASFVAASLKQPDAENPTPPTPPRSPQPILEAAPPIPAPSPAPQVAPVLNGPGPSV